MSRARYVRLLSILVGLGVSAFLLLPIAQSQIAGPSRRPDPLSTTSGSYSGYRIDDSTTYLYGDFRLISSSGQTTVAAHRMRIVEETPGESIRFENDFLSGHAFSDGVEIHSNWLLLDKVLKFSAEQVRYSDDSLTVRLSGQPVVQGEDVKIVSGNVTLFLDRWKPAKR